MVQWFLGFCTFTAEGTGQSAVGELRFHMHVEQPRESYGGNLCSGGVRTPQLSVSFLDNLRCTFVGKRAALQAGRGTWDRELDMWAWLKALLLSGLDHFLSLCPSFLLYKPLM